MSNDKPRHEPTDAREDAFAELSRAGYRSVPGAGGEHAERLARMRARVEGSAASAAPEAKVVSLPSRPRVRTWWAAAASVAILLAAALWQFGGGVAEESVALETLREAAAVPDDDAPEQETVAYEAVPERAEATTAPATESTPPPSVPATAPTAPRARRSAEFSAPRPASTAPDTTAVAIVPLPSQAAPSSPPARANPRLAEAEADVAAAEPQAEASPVAETPPLADAPPQAGVAAGKHAPPPLAEARRVQSRSADSALAAATADGTDSYALSRARIPELRRVTGVIADDSGTPLPGATLEVEGTGQRYVVGEDGAFDLSLPPGGRVGLVTVPDSEDSLYVDLTTSERYDFAWPAKPSPDQLPEVRAGGHANVLAPLPARAPHDEAFEAYLDGLDAGLPGPVELVFNVNRRGEPTGIRLGPTYDADRKTFKRARALLEAAPPWPERYRRRRWRAVVR